MPQRRLEDWSLVYTEWNPAQQRLREALCTLGNGYLATRGAAEEVSAGGPHYPGTYLAGGYDRAETRIAGHLVENEDFVNWPNWLPLTFRHDDGDWFDLQAVELLDFRQELDVYRGVLERSLHFRDHRDRETKLISRRLVSMHEPHHAAIEWSLVPQNWSGEILVRSGLDGSVTNSGVERYQDLEGRHLRVLDRGAVAEDAIFLVVETRQSRIRMAQAARTRLFAGDQAATSEREVVEHPNSMEHVLRVPCRQFEELRVEKVVTISTSRDHAISEPADEVRKTIRRAPGFGELLERHERSWQHLWKHCDLELGTERDSRSILRLHTFHMLQTVSPNTIDRDVGVPARGLHGEAYRGHVFWDELFVFPSLNLRLPELTRELLMYRYRRLNEARHMAREAGYRGAMFPWQSGSDGREESQDVHLNPQSGRWIPDDTYLQRHVNAAIAYNVWQYLQATDDREFLRTFGAELILEIARFWASIAELDPARDRYVIRNVVGPDEFHTRYPGSDEPGLDNNAYTNVMAAWVLWRASQVLESVAADRRQELVEDLEISREELGHWDDVSRRMFVPFHDDGIVSQFEGYEELEDFDWDACREKHGDIQRLDRILEAEGDTPNRYKASKQADVLMLFFLFSTEELEQVFERMGYTFEPDWIPRNVEYYLARTSHGSTLSRIVHAWVLARSDRSASWELFQDAVRSDVADIQGGTTEEGIHLGAMAGTVDLAQRCYTGVEMRDEILWLNPSLPEPLQQMRFRLRYRGHWLTLRINHREVEVSVDRGWACSAKIGVDGEVHEMCEGETRTFALEGS